MLEETQQKPIENSLVSPAGTSPGSPDPALSLDFDGSPDRDAADRDAAEALRLDRRLETRPLKEAVRQRADARGSNNLFVPYG